MSIPPPPPGFEIVPMDGAIPPPPEGFELVGQPSGAMGAADQMLRGVYRGVDAIASIPGAIVGGAVNAVAPGEGDRFKWRGYLQPPSEQISGRVVEPSTTAERYANSIGQAVGGSVVPMGASLRLAQGAAGPAAASTIGQIGQGIVQSARSNPAQFVGLDLAGSVAGGSAQQAAADAGATPGWQALAGLAGAGAVVPPMLAAGARAAQSVEGVTGPAAARLGQNIRNATGRSAAEVEPRPASLGAAAGPGSAPPTPPAMTGADAAAIQQLANQLTSANVPRGEIARRLARAEADSLIGNPMVALVDLDPSLQRLAGSVVRQSVDAGNRGQRFMAGRQTGITPADGMPDGSGVPTREFMSRPSPIDPPMGQFERVRDSLRSAMQVPPRSAYRTDQDLIQLARAQANQQYGETYRAANGVDIRPHIEPVLEAWTRRAADEPREISRAIMQAVNLYRAPSGTVGTLQRFQRSKEFLDGKIENYMESLAGRNRSLGGTLNDMQRELLAAVDAIPNVGQLYSTARGAFGSVQQMREALELGRSALREGSEASADAYRALSPGQQQMFRVGLVDDIERQMARQKRGADVTQLFQSPKTQELLAEVLPDDQLRRLGVNIQTENTMTRSNYEVFGNSKTQQRTADDEAFNQMSGVIETLRSTRSVSDAAFKFTQRILDKAFGFRADTAEALARRLFTADRADLDVIIGQITSRMGPSRAAQFESMMREFQSKVIATPTNTATAASPQDRRRRQEYIVQSPMGGSRYLPPDPKPMPPYQR